MLDLTFSLFDAIDFAPLCAPAPLRKVCSIENKYVGGVFVPQESLRDSTGGPGALGNEGWMLLGCSLRVHWVSEQRESRHVHHSFVVVTDWKRPGVPT